MKTRLDLKIFLFSSAAIILTLFFAFIRKDQAYEAKINLVFIPRNEATSENISTITRDITKIPASVSFYDKLVKSNEDIIDKVAALPENKREAYWKNKLDISQPGKRGFVQIGVLDEDPRQAQILLWQTTRNLTAEVAKKYNLRDELSVEIISEPTIKPGVTENLGWIILKSFILGLLAGFLVEEISKVFSFPKKSSSPKKKRKIDWGKMPDFSKKSNAPKPEEKLAAETKSAPIKKSSAPSNLPIADDSGLWQIQENLYNGKTETASPEPSHKEDILREATPEEIKERLNKLLAGKF